jgi:four helix bundle protein
MANITRFEEIESWKSARDLTNKVYAFTNQDGFNRDFGLRDQIRRACISIMSNIAEGFESRTDTQFINFLGMARASAGEVRSQLYIALDQKYILQEQFNNAFQLAQTCSRQITNFIKYLDTNPRPKRISDDSADYDV